MNLKVRIKKMMDDNQGETYLAVIGVKKFLGDKDPEFGELPLATQLDLAMKFFQCERGRLQKHKLYMDFVAPFISITMSAAAVIIALYFKK